MPGHSPSPEFTPAARRLGTASAVAVAGLLVAYAGTLIVGLVTLPAPDQPIRGPLFTLLEVLILTLMPASVALMAAVHAWAPRDRKIFSRMALVFMSVVAALTSAVHFVILTLSRHPAYADSPQFLRALAFEWPSVVYVLDILAWDVFFALSMAAAAPVFRGSRLAASIRFAMIGSAVLAAAGLSGVVTGDMALRNIGILGYVAGFLVVAVLLAILFFGRRP